MVGKFCGPIMSGMDVCHTYLIHFVHFYDPLVEQKTTAKIK